MIRNNTSESMKKRKSSYDLDSIIANLKAKQDEEEKSKQQEMAFSSPETPENYQNRINSMIDASIPKYGVPDNMFGRKSPVDIVMSQSTPEQQSMYNKLSSQPIQTATQEPSILDKAKQVVESIPHGAIDATSRFLLRAALNFTDEGSDTNKGINKILNTPLEQRQQAWNRTIGETNAPSSANNLGYGIGQTLPMLLGGALAGPGMAAQLGTAALIGAAEGYGETGKLKDVIKGAGSNAAFIGAMKPLGEIFSAGAKSLNLNKLTQIIAQEVGGMSGGTAASGLVNMGFGAAENGMQGVKDNAPTLQDFSSNIAAGLLFRGGASALKKVGSLGDNILSDSKLRVPANPETMTGSKKISESNIIDLPSNAELLQRKLQSPTPPDIKVSTGNYTTRPESNIIELPNNAELLQRKLPAPMQESPDFKLSTLEGNRYQLNPNLDNALQEYESAIQTIQNHFGRYQLTPEEVARIKPELGIDLDRIVSNIFESQKYNTVQSPEYTQMKRNAGVMTDKAKDVYGKILEDPNKPNYNIPDRYRTDYFNTNKPSETKSAETSKKEISDNAKRVYDKIIKKSEEPNYNIPDRYKRDYFDKEKLNEARTKKKEVISENVTRNDTISPSNSSPNDIKGNERSDINSTINKSIESPKNIVSKEFQGLYPETPDTVEGKFESRIGKEPKKESYRFTKKKLEDIYQDSKGLKEPSKKEKFKKGLIELYNAFTRPIKELPVNTQNAEAYKEFNRHKATRSIVTDETVRTLKNELKHLDEEGFNKLGRKVMLDDFAEDIKNNIPLRNEFTSKDVEIEGKALDKELTPEIKQALAERKINRKKIIDEYISAYKEIGIDKSKAFTKENYFRHQVLDRHNELNSNIKGTGPKMQVPLKRSFQKQRTGKGDSYINTNYLQAEGEVLTQLKYDTQVVKMFKNLLDNYDIISKVKAEAKAKKIKNWESLIPEGYKKGSLNENAFFTAIPVTEREAKRLTLELLSKEGGISSKKIVKLLNKTPIRVQREFGQYVMPSDIVDTLNRITLPEKQMDAAKWAEKALNGWKIWETGGNPKQFTKYNLRNVSANLDTGMFNPKAVTNVPKAIEDIWKANREGKFSLELNIYRKLGGFNNLLTAQEIRDIDKLHIFDNLKEKDAKFYLNKAIDGSIRNMKAVTNSLEMVAKYSNFLEYRRQMMKSPKGLPENWGASNPDIIKGLKSIDDKAYRMANDLMGNYDNVSEAGKTIRKYLVPFYSWTETNLKRHMQLIKNIYNNTELTENIGRSILGDIANIGIKTLISAGKSVVALTGFSTAIALWNSTMFPDLEDKIPEHDRKRLHMIWGSDAEGNPIYFSRMGSVTDFLEWFGLGDVPQEVINAMNGKKSLKEAFTLDKLKEKAKQPFEKAITSLSPYIKTPVEMAFGVSGFPSPFSPKPIRDRGQYLAGNVGLRQEYDALTGKPGKPYFSRDTLGNFIYYKSEADKVAYGDTKNLVTDYKKKIGKYNEGYSENKRTDSLLNYKLALKYNDKKAIEKYKQEYLDNGGKPDGLQKSVNTLHPLYGLNTNDRLKFVGELSEKERKQMDIAIQYYQKLLANQNTK